MSVALQVLLALALTVLAARSTRAGRVLARRPGRPAVIGRMTAARAALGVSVGAGLRGTGAQAAPVEQ